MKPEQKGNLFFIILLKWQSYPKCWAGIVMIVAITDMHVSYHCKLAVFPQWSEMPSWSLFVKMWLFCYYPRQPIIFTCKSVSSGDQCERNTMSPGHEFKLKDTRFSSVVYFTVVESRSYLNHDHCDHHPRHHHHHSWIVFRVLINAYF